QAIGNGLLLLSVSTLEDGFYHLVLSSREKSISRVGMKIRPYHTTGGLKSVTMDGLLMILGYGG
ncbi:hypothetical protein L9G74_20450, partial [Shewanella sp. C32]|nr:hypothetical protein [Shewanella electrica]